MQPASEQPAEASWFGRVTDAYNMLWKMIIRPPRDLYSLEELGPAKFRLGKRIYERRDLQLRSSRGHALECSHFVPAKSPEALRPCVVYLHGNCSSRLEAFDALPVLLPRDLTVFTLDLSGSGRSEGEYISLGHHEEQDLKAVLTHLRESGKVTQIGLWGRSMGAATSILRAAEDKELAACVLDSAFGDLRIVAEELVNRGRIKIPQFIVNFGLEIIRQEVNTRAEFDPLDLMPINYAPKAICPALFGAAQDDTFVLPHHTQDLHNVWNGDRMLRIFDGGHNGVRPSWFLEEAADFLVERLSSPPGASRDRPPAVSSPVRDRGAERARMVEHLGPMDAGKRQIVDELIKRGFGGDMAFEAAKRYPSVEAATAWLLNQSGSTKDDLVSKPIRTQAPLAGAHAKNRPDMLSGDTPGPDVDENGLPAGGRAPVKGKVVEQLRFLGFDQHKCEEAARRCPTVEDAMDWLVSQDVVVKL
jgi:pimeloyl-ACP methyl ester carboxylesterase